MLWIRLKLRCSKSCRDTLMASKGVATLPRETIFMGVEAPKVSYLAFAPDATGKQAHDLDSGYYRHCQGKLNSSEEEKSEKRK
jgi:hypothetical protein